MAKQNLYTVHYEGWLTVTASDEDNATQVVNKMLSDSGIINDGDSGEWEISDVEDEEYATY
jgi:hypothetical protein